MSHWEVHGACGTVDATRGLGQYGVEVATLLLLLTAAVKKVVNVALVKIPEKSFSNFSHASGRIFARIIRDLSRISLLVPIGPVVLVIGRSQNGVARGKRFEIQLSSRFLCH